MKRFVYIFLALVCCAVSVSATNVSIPGSMNNWDISASTMTLSEDGTASISYTLNAGNYEYKIAFESWSDCLSTSTTITRENNSATFSASYSGNAIFQADVTGDYMFTWTFETNTLTVTYPEAGVQQCGNDLYWSLANGTLTITGSGAMYDYSSGAAPWYNERSNIKNLSLPEGLTYIGQYAFYYCSALQSITIPNSVVSIGSYAFYDCNGFASITIPDNVTTLGNYAFYGCENLISVALGSGITSIGNSAFYYCTNLDYIRIDAQTPPTLGNSSSIYSSPICYVPVGTLEAYQSSSWATRVSRFEESEQQITCAEAATRCPSTPSVVHYTIYGYVTELTENNSSTDNTLSFWMADMPIGGKVLYAHNVVPYAATDRTPQKGDYVKLQGYIMLHDAMPATADGCTIEILSAPTTNLTTQCGDSLYWMLADSTLTIVGSGAMYDYSTSAPAPWSELKNSFHTLVLPQGLTNIGDNAFSDCAALQAVAIPTTVTNIGAAAFQNCTALTTVLIPEGVQHLEDNAFKGCSALATVYAQAQTLPTLGIAAFNSKPVCYVPTGQLSAYQASDWANFATNITEQDKKCGDNLYYLFADSTLTIVGTGEMSYSSLPWTSSQIARAFLPDGLKSIYSSAFNSSKLTSISLPNTLTTINYRAFSSCSQLTSIVLPDSVTSIGQEAFYYSGIYNSTANWENGALYIGNYLIATNSNLPATYAIKEGTRLIADYTFSGKSSSLTSVTIPESVVAIGNYAFYNCSNITYIRIPNSVKHIGYRAFYNCSQLAFVDLSEGLTIIGEEAFNNCDALTHITIPSTVTSIGNSAFYSCGALNAIYLEATTPPTLGSSVFSYTSSSLKCYLACGLLGEYLASSSWTNLFSNFIEYCPSDTYHTFDYEDTNTQWQFIQSGQTNQWTIGIAAGSASMKNKSLYISNDGTSFAYDQNAASTSWAYLPVTLTTTDSIFFSWKGVGETCCDYAHAYLIPAGSLPTAGSTTLPEGAIAVGNKINQQTTWQCDTIVPNVEGNYNLCFMWTNDESSGTTSIAIDDVRIGSAIGIAANKCGDDLYWTLADSTLTITGSGAMFDYVKTAMIPWYSQRTNIRTVVLPEGLTNISRNAFYGCTNLVSINIPSTLTSIASCAFYDCQYLRGPINIPEGSTMVGDSTFYNCRRLSAISMPNNMDSIGVRAFYNCDSLTQLTLPDSLVRIKAYAFYDCDYIKRVVIPNNVTDIASYAFYSSAGLTTVTIGSRVDSLGTNVFNNCSALDTLYVLNPTPPILASNALYSSPICYVPTGSLSAYQSSAWANYVSGFVEQGQCGDNLYWTISEGVLSITGSGAMYDYTAEALAPWYSQRTNITTIDLPDGLTSIGAWAFYDCDSISSISIPSTVTTIGNEALYHCSNLTSVSIPDAVTTLGYEALANCTLLTQVTLGSSITSIGGYAFSYCPALAKLTLKSVTPPTPGDYIFSNSSAPACYVPCGTLSAYQSSAWATLVASIEEQCYDENYHNFEVDIQNEAWQFVQDGQINYWTIGTAAGSATSGSQAMYITTNGTDYNYNTSYNSVSWACLPITLETTDTISFYWKGTGESSYDYVNVYLFPMGSLPTAGSTTTANGTVQLNSTYLNRQTDWQLFTATPALSGNYNLCFMWRTDGGGGSNPPVAVDDIRIGNTEVIANNKCGENLYWEYNNGTLTITGSGAMYDYRFENYAPWYSERESISAVSLPQGLTSIGNYAFYDCSSLASIIIPNSITSIGDYAFYTCFSLTSIAIPESVINIGEKAFASCSLTSIAIPESVINIGESVFSSCSSLTSIVVESGNTKYDSRNNCNAIIESATNTLVAGCQNTTIPNTITSIGNYAFWCCYSLTSITIPNSVTSIGGNAFSYCSSLTSITIPNSVISIERYAFSYCSSLTSITIPNSVISIERYAFFSCDLLTSITIPNSVTSIGDSSFRNCSSLASVYVEAQTPPTLGTTAFNSSPTCYIPCGTLAAYQASDWASQVGSFIEENCEQNDTVYNAYICYGETYAWEVNGTAYSESGTYTYSDSWTGETTAILNLTVSPAPVMEVDSVTINENELPYIWDGYTINAAGGYTYTEESVHGCDSVIHELYLTVESSNSGSTSVDYCDFESSDINAQWQFIQSGQTNYWTIGTAAGSASAGSNALYITNDGYNYSYTNNSVSVSWAYIPVELETSDTISFYWKGTAESSYDNMRVYLYPENSLPTAGSSTASNDAVQVTSTYLCGQSSWQYFTGTPGVAGRYNLCFMWKNDASSGSMPIAVDEIRISQMTVPALPENQCGENLYWAYNNGTLTISGSGAMYDSHELLSYRQQSWFPDAVTAVSLPRGLTHIGATAFADCSNLTSITIPSTVISIGAEAFAWSGIERITLPESVQDIAEMAFVKCGKMTNFVWRGTPSTLGNVYNHMFLGCNQLDTVIAPARMWECTSANADIHTYYGFPSHIRYVEVTSGELSSNAISYIASSYESLTTLDISAVSNASLPTQAFASWTALETLHLPVNLTVIPYQMVYGCTNLSTISIPNYVQEFGNEAFSGCVKLHSIDFADGQNLLSIGQYAFYNCSTLVSVTVPEGVQTLGAYAFYNNASLVKIKLPSTLSVIGNYAFGKCQQLMKMNVAAYAPPTVSSNTFYSVPRTATVYVPESAINTYKSTYIWNEFFIESNVQDALDNIFTDSEEQVQKLLIHGQVFIIRNGKCYDLMGQEVETEM